MTIIFQSPHPTHPTTLRFLGETSTKPSPPNADFQCLTFELEGPTKETRTLDGVGHRWFSYNHPEVGFDTYAYHLLKNLEGLDYSLGLVKAGLRSSCVYALTETVDSDSLIARLKAFDEEDYLVYLSEVTLDDGQFTQWVMVVRRVPVLQVFEEPFLAHLFQARYQLKGSATSGKTYLRYLSELRELSLPTLIAYLHLDTTLTYNTDDFVDSFPKNWLTHDKSVQLLQLTNQFVLKESLNDSFLNLCLYMVTMGFPVEMALGQLWHLYGPML